MPVQALVRWLLTLMVALTMTGCAVGPTLRTTTNPQVDFSQYETFGFASELGTDRAGYETFITRYFKEAVREEMEALGFRYTENDPDLIANFYTRIETRSEVRSHPPTLGVGYYGYRYGLYTAWPYYARDLDTVHYKYGTANIDIVDAERRQLVWEGVAEDRLTREVLDNPKPAIEQVVHDLFKKFPTRRQGTETPS